MSTSTLLVEIVVMGVLTIIALLCDLGNIHYAGLDSVHTWYINLHLGTATGAALIFGVAYPVGWIMNSLSYIFTVSVFRATDAYRERRAKFYQSRTQSFGVLIKVFCKQFRARFKLVDVKDDDTFIGYLGNYNTKHARVMQGASDYSTRLLMEHFSMLRINRASFLISFIILPASIPIYKPLENLWWTGALPINIVAMVILYRLTKKAHIYYKLLRDSVHHVIAEQTIWERYGAEEYD